MRTGTFPVGTRAAGVSSSVEQSSRNRIKLKSLKAMKASSEKCRSLSTASKKSTMAVTAPPLIVIFIILTFGRKCLGQPNPDGFISIDCGSTGQSPDPQTNLPWVDDGDYILTGQNGVVQNPDWVNATSINVNYQALKTFRYFPQDDAKSKYCYELPLTTSNVSFLLRALFLHGNATELSLPIDFEVYVNDTQWIYLSWEDGDDLWQYHYQESIFFLPPGGNITNVCLVPNQGLPFISSLELRQFDSEGLMYANSFDSRTTQEVYFNCRQRENFGPSPDDVHILRYPDDKYDRLWAPAYITNIGMRVNATQPILQVGPDVNSIPLSVINDAWVNTGTYENIANIHFDMQIAQGGSIVYGIVYSAILDITIAGDPVSAQMEADADNVGNFTITTLPSQKSFFHVMNANFTVLTLEGPLFINALEYYQQYTFISPTTNKQNVAEVNLLKEVLNMTTWQGDPCVPVPYDWLGCELGYYVGSEWFVNNLTLSQLENSSRAIEELYRRANGAWTIYYLSITSSHMTSDSFQSLLQSFINATTVYTLNMSYNDISILPNVTWWTDVANGSQYQLNSLDFSYNQISQLPSFVDLPFSNQTKILNISNNNILSEFLAISSFSNLSSLQILNISSNGMEGNLPISLSKNNLPSLQQLDISNNSFSGSFPSSFYIPSASDSFQLIADNNKFGGVLDLTPWYQKLKSLSDNDETHATSTLGQNIPTFNQLFSLKNNQISSIQPSAEDFGPLIENFMKNTQTFNQSGFLLGGNPYCAGAKSFAQRYLCRTSSAEFVYQNTKKKSKTGIILASVLGGAFLLLCLAFFSVSIWLLRKKVHALKRVERELSSRRVQPPYYSYYDLKLATNHFSKNNQLGRGNFGEVFKGVLADGTTIAVKRLFISNKKQVLNEFLNEVVLITGIKHKNLIQLKGCCIENEERILVYGYAENGNVEDALWSQNAKIRLTWRNRFKICVGIASGLTYLHEELDPKIIHRDIKPANILLDKNLNPKIADFGLAKHFMEDVDRHVTQVISGTRGYFAPEYISDGILSTKVDVFSFGILVLEIVSGRRNLDISLPPEEVQLRSWALKLKKSDSALKLMDPSLRSDYSEFEVVKVIDIALMCVNLDPDLRPTMSEVETMLLEGHERVFDILCANAFNKGDNQSSLDKIFNSFGNGMGNDTVSTLFSGRGSQGSGASSSSTKLKQTENHPLLSSDSLKDVEAPEQLTSADAREEYERTLHSMERSLSERIKYQSPR